MDTTLRDGAQALGITFSLQDKISIAERLDRLGFDYIEGGYPGSNPKDTEFFKAATELKLRHSQIVPFGSTRRKGVKPEEDKVLAKLLNTGTKTVVLFGKSWTLHVEDVLLTTLEENLKMIADSIRYLRENGREVIFDAEHYFDGFKSDPEYAVKTVRTAEEAGARAIVLCDTNGGTLTYDVERIVAQTVAELDSKVGIHCHNDSGLAVANTLAAVKAGATHVHGTINGFGERCGNADLCQVIPTLKFKMDLDVLGSGKTSEDSLKALTSLSRYVYELTNISPNSHQPYVGSGAFSHKAGMHVDAILKNSGAYEHIDPELIGNERRFLISELSGRSGIMRVASDLGLNLEERKDVAVRVLQRVKKLESEGYHLENADATMRLIFLKELGQSIEPFKIKRWKVSTLKEIETRVKAEVTVEVNEEEYHEVGEGVGPVHSLDIALRKALLRRFPQLDRVRLVNYKVTVVDSVTGTASSVRVFIEFRDDGHSWATTSVSRNITEASETALAEGYIYWLLTRP
ncbi:MAG: citramalate synthase [Nitrososphaerales archaeon]